MTAIEQRRGHAAERIVVVLDELLVTPFFITANRELAALIVVVGVAGLLVLARDPRPQPLNGLQLPWLFGTSVLAALLAPTTVGAPIAFALWLTGFGLWVLFRRARSSQLARLAAAEAIGQMIVEERDASTEPVGRSAPHVAWPVVVRYSSGRTWASRIAAIFLGLIAVESVVRIGQELATGSVSAWGLHAVWSSVLLWLFLIRGSRAPTSILLDAEHIEVARLFGRAVFVLWADIVEVRRVAWTAESGRNEELVLVGLFGPLLTIDLEDPRQRMLVALIRERLSAVPWRAETRTALA